MIRLADSRATVFRTAGRPTVRRRRAYLYCVRGGGRVYVVFDRRGQVRLIATTATNHRVRRHTPGDSARRTRRAYPQRLGLRRGWTMLRRRGSDVFFGIRRGRVRFIAVAHRNTVVHRRATIRRMLREAGL